MAKKELFRMTENDVHNILESVMKRVLREGSVETGDLGTWEYIKEMIGAEAMLQMVWNYFSSDDLSDLIHSMCEDLVAEGIDVPGWEDEEDAEDYDGDEDWDDGEDYYDDEEEDDSTI